MKSSLKDKRVIAAAKEIQHLCFHDNTTFGQARRKFFSIMKKYGIEWGVPAPGGRGTVGATPEWATLVAFFLERYTAALHMQIILGGIKQRTSRRRKS